MRTGIHWTSHEDSIIREHYGTITAKEIEAKGLIDRSWKAIHQRAWILGLKSPIKHTLYHNIRLDFFKTPTIESAYWAGFLCADGSLVKDPNKPNTYRLYLCASIKDEEHIRLFQQTMGHDGKMGHMMNQGSVINGHTIKGGEMCFINICQAGRFREDLAKFGIIPDKTKRITPPLLDSNVLKLAYLKGYIDGDGSIIAVGDRYAAVSLVSSCLEIMNWFNSLLDEHFPSIIPDRMRAGVLKKPVCNAWHYRVGGCRAIRLIRLLSKIPTPELARKWKNPRIVRLLEEGIVNRLMPEVWAIHLPIEDEIDTFLSTYIPAILSPTPLQPAA